jgi:hypothetical protein
MVVLPTGMGMAWRPVWGSGLRGESVVELRRRLELEGRDQDGTRRESVKCVVDWMEYVSTLSKG